MRVARRIGALGVLVALTATGCSDTPPPYYPPDPSENSIAREFDPGREAAQNALTVVPAEAVTLEVTDFDQLRLILGYGDLDGDSAPAQRAAFWRDAQRAPTFSDGMLRPADRRLRAEFGFGQDDVAWEARWGEGTLDSWVIAFHEEVPLDGIRGAIEARVGPLAEATLYPDLHLVSSAEIPELEATWAADDQMQALVVEAAAATYVSRTCRSFDDVFGDGTQAQLAPAPAAELAELGDLSSYSISFGGKVVTVRLGRDRPDAFSRLRFAEVMPATDPEFGEAFERGVADPSSGRLGYDLGKADAAIELTRAGKLPFAVCGGA